MARLVTIEPIPEVGDLVEFEGANYSAVTLHTKGFGLKNTDGLFAKHGRGVIELKKLNND